MSIANFVVPPWVKPMLVVLSYVLVGAGCGYVAWELKAAQGLKAVIVEQKATIKMEVDQAAVSGVVANKVEKAKEKVRIVYVEREKEIDQHDQARVEAGKPPVYPTADVSAIPARLACVWNSGNKGVLPPPECLDDAAPSGLVLRDIEKQHDTEAAITKQLAVDLRGLQLWVCEQALLHNGTLPEFEVCKLGEIP